MTDIKSRHTIACVPLPEDECICPDLVPGCRRPNPTPIADAAEAAGHNVITMDDIRVDPLTAGLFKEPGNLLPARLQLPVVIVTADADPAELAEKIVRQNPEHFGHVDIDGVYAKREPVDTIPREEWRSDMNGVLAGRDAAVEKAHFWRRLAVIASSACVIGTGINTGNLLGWW